MAKNKTKYKKINNEYFKCFSKIINTVLEVDYNDIISNMKDASLDDHDKGENIFLYDGSIINMDAIKLDDMTQHLLQYMRKERNLRYFEQPYAVDAVCVNQKNEWFLIEFKNRPIYKTKDGEQKLDKGVVLSIEQKMFGSIWFLLSLASFSSKELFGDDVTEFARTHFTYIAVVSREKNPDEYRRIHESPKNLYTPTYFRKYVGYYFKDVYMLTEYEFRNFVLKFKA